MITLSSIAKVAMEEFDVKCIKIYEDKGKVTFQFKKKDYKKLTEENITAFEYKCRPAGVFFTYEEESRWNVITNTVSFVVLTNAVMKAKKGLKKLHLMS